MLKMMIGRYALRERSAGRLDLQLRYQSHYNSSDFTAPPIVLGVIQRLMGERARLKSMHAVVGLPGCEEQGWHRDSPLLYPDCPMFHDEDAHARDGGVHLPPYAQILSALYIHAGD